MRVKCGPYRWMLAAPFGLGTPTALFYWPNGLGLRYDVLDDGQFVMVRTDPDAGPNRFRVVLNWTQELLERVPVP